MASLLSRAFHLPQSPFQRTSAALSPFYSRFSGHKSEMEKGQLICGVELMVPCREPGHETPKEAGKPRACQDAAPAPRLLPAVPW